MKIVINYERGRKMVDLRETRYKELDEMRKESFKQGIFNERERIIKMIKQLKFKIALNSREEQVIKLVKEELLKYL